MRTLLIVSFAFLLLDSTGCMVLDEVDAANAKMSSASKSKAKAESLPAATPNNASQQRNALLEQSKEWWGRATSLAPAEVKASVVSCRFRDGTQFMSKDDCLSRGGVPGSVSG